jgi:hypothetical protein
MRAGSVLFIKKGAAVDFGLKAMELFWCGLIIIDGWAYTGAWTSETVGMLRKSVAQYRTGQ